MTYRLLACLLLLLCFKQAWAQNYSRSKEKFAIGISPGLFIERHVGGFIQYDFSEKFAVLAEYGKRNSDPAVNYDGYKLVVQPRYFAKLAGSRAVFYGADLRFGNYTTQKHRMIYSTADTLPARLLNYRKKFTGFAFIFGAQVALTRNQRLCLESQTGIGPKFKNVTTDAPAGYKPMPYETVEGPGPDAFDNTGTTIYFPSSIRFLYKLF